MGKIVKTFPNQNNRHFYLRMVRTIYSPVLATFCSLLDVLFKNTFCVPSLISAFRLYHAKGYTVSSLILITTL